MTFSVLIKEIIARRNWILLITLAVAIISGVYYNRVPFIYRSTVTFFVDDDETEGLKFTEADQNSLILAKATNGNRLYHLAKSSEMLDYLITRFNLYNHYNINRNDSLYHEKATAVLINNITVAPTQFNSISITVADYDKMMAVDIANEIFKKLDQMNKDLIVENVGRKIKIYDQLLSNVKKRSFEQTEELKRLIDDCKTLVADKKVKDGGALISDLKVKLALLNSQLTSVNEDLLKTIKVYEIASASLQKENLPNLRMINSALPDLHSPVNNGVLWTIAFSFLSVCVCISGIILIHEYKYDLKAFFN